MYDSKTETFFCTSGPRTKIIERSFFFRSINSKNNKQAKLINNLFFTVSFKKTNSHFSLDGSWLRRLGQRPVLGDVFPGRRRLVDQVPRRPLAADRPVVGRLLRGKPSLNDVQFMRERRRPVDVGVQIPLVVPFVEIHLALKLFFCKVLKLGCFYFFVMTYLFRLIVLNNDKNVR